MIYLKTDNEKVEQKENTKNFIMKHIFLITVIIWVIFMVSILIVIWVNKDTIQPDISVPEPQVTITIPPTPVIFDDPYTENQEETQEKEEVEEEFVFNFNQAELEMIARTVWGEAQGCTKTEQAAVIWCILNRVDSENPYFPYKIADVITQPNQFYYSENFPVWPELVELAKDVLTRYYTEKLTGEDCGRVLPMEYCWFGGDGKHNWFRDEFKFEDANIWDWSLPSPYEE